MISDTLSLRRHELTSSGEPFVTATVVRVQHPTSVEPGAVALIRGDGTIEGFVGGVCAEQSVRLYSLRAIESGEAMLLRIMPGVGEEEVAREEDGAVTVNNPCLSGGAIEIFLEPALPPPRMTVAGDSLIAVALRSLGATVGLSIDDGPPRAEDLALVVAAHGRDELGALRAALEAGVPYVGLVASPKRGAGVLDELRADGVDDELLALIDTPAGLDIGARTPAEIALSILVRIVEVRRSDAFNPAAAAAVGGAASIETAVDPICGMTVVIGPDTVRGVGPEGEPVYFCCEGCRTVFDERRAVVSGS